MKLTVIILIATMVHVSASSFGQKITLKEKEAKLTTIFKQINAQSGYFFLYDLSVLDKSKLVTIDLKNASIHEVLEKCFEGQNLTYKVTDKAVVVQEKTVLDAAVDKVKSFFSTIDVHGRVVDENGKGLAGAVIKVKDSKKTVISDLDGYFILPSIDDDAFLVISYLGYQVQEIKAANDIGNIRLHQIVGQLDEVEISTGYQIIPKERSTGSFDFIGKELLNRAVSTNILDRLNGVTSSLIFTNNGNHQFGQSNIEIRGRSTLFSNSDPLIVIDNFPYDGDLNNINPNDIENITILKDAAAASAWGSRSGNGVIVITTKKGKLNSRAQVNINSYVNVGSKPNLYYAPQLSSEQYIGIEQFLFKKGAYNSVINRGYGALSPAVEIFLARRNGIITSVDSLAQINTLKGYDSRDQISKYFYRSNVNQQYQADITGGGVSQKYFISGGYDKNIYNSINNNYDRITLNASNTYYFFKNKLELFSNIIYTSSKSQSTPVITSTDYPYDQIADSNGNPLAIARTLRIPYASSAGNGKLLNWLYKPLDELNKGYSKTNVSLTDYRVNLSLSYSMTKNLKASALYSYEKGITENNNLNEADSYFSRNLINTYTQVNAISNTITYPIPPGGILNTGFANVQSQNGRLQLNYSNKWGKNTIEVIGGTEIKDYTNFSTKLTLYGYNSETATNQNAAINYSTSYPFFYRSSLTSRIPTGTSQVGNTNRFFSYYFNGAYTYDGKYIASISARRDESNLFGVTSNQKGVPLWSAGLSWIVNKEDFFNLDWVPQVKLRATYGYTGNVNNSISAYLTAIGGIDYELYNAYSSTIVNPPNPSLRWEKNENINIGLDFETKNNRLSGSVDYWIKKGIDLIGNSPIAPQTGVTQFTGNSANTFNKGVDIQLTSTNLNAGLKWYTTILYNHTSSKVTDYKVLNGTNYDVISANYNNPLQGFPYYSMFSFKYKGLNSIGDPIGYLNGTESTDYNGIYSSTNRSEIVFNGSATPTSFGSLRNTFVYRGIDFSFNITYKFGYYFRRASLDNGTIYSPGVNAYHVADYGLQWQKPGDELLTETPALVYPSDIFRNILYTYSDVLVQRGDHIRLQDVRLGYTFKKNKSLPFRNLNIFTYVNNIGILWRSNKYKIDPDYPSGGIPAVRTIAFGLKIDL